MSTLYDLLHCKNTENFHSKWTKDKKLIKAIVRFDDQKENGIFFGELCALFGHCLFYFSIIAEKL